MPVHSCRAVGLPRTRIGRRPRPVRLAGVKEGEAAKSRKVEGAEGEWTQGRAVALEAEVESIMG